MCLLEQALFNEEDVVAQRCRIVWQGMWPWLPFLVVSLSFYFSVTVGWICVLTWAEGWCGVVTMRHLFEEMLWVFLYLTIFFLGQVKTMEDDCGASSTSPFLTESLELAMEVEHENSRPSFFSCAFDSQSGGRRFSAESHLASGSLKRYGIFLNYKYKSLPRCSFHSCLVLTGFQVSLFSSSSDPEINLVIPKWEALLCW